MNENRTSYDALLTWLGSHKIFGPIFAILLVLFAILGAVKTIDESLKVFERLQKPHLELSFITENNRTEMLEVNPQWSDELGRGFSNPIQTKISLRNTGKVRATNVKIHMIYRHGIISFSSS